MSFNPEPKTQANEVLFDRNFKEISQLPLVFNNDNAIQTTSQ